MYPLIFSIITLVPNVEFKNKRSTKFYDFVKNFYKHIFEHNNIEIPHWGVKEKMN